MPPHLVLFSASGWGHRPHVALCFLRNWQETNTRGDSDAGGDIGAAIVLGPAYVLVSRSIAGGAEQNAQKVIKASVRGQQSKHMQPNVWFG